MDAESQKIIRKGLTSHPKYFPQWFRYDKIGSIYNYECLACPSYYFHRAEIDLLSNEKGIQNGICGFDTVIDMGSGNAEKTEILFEYILKENKRLRYYPIDISDEFLKEIVDKLAEIYGSQIDTKPIAAEYKEAVKNLGNIERPMLVVWFGGIQSLSYEDQVNTLSMLSDTMTASDVILLSVDITLDKETVELAYMDPQGKATQFYMNNILRLNRDFKADANEDDFKVECVFARNTAPDAVSCVKVWARSLRNVSIAIPGLDLTLDLEKDEKIYLHEGEGISCKYTTDQLKSLGNKAGLSVKETYTNEHAAFVMFCKQ